VPLARTEEPGAVGTTSAVLKGAVDPDGQAATYSFEVQIGDGVAAKYLPVYTADAGAVAGQVQETFLLTGLQPGTQYTYRMTARNGFGETVGIPKSFITEGLAEVLPVPRVLRQVEVPSIPFPKVRITLTGQQRLAQALRACGRKPARKRAACRRSARKRYEPAKATGKRR
jgi:hypothetical protein